MAALFGWSVPASEKLHQLSICSFYVPLHKQYYRAVRRNRNEVLWLHKAIPFNSHAKLFQVKLFLSTLCVEKGFENSRKRHLCLHHRSYNLDSYLLSVDVCDEGTLDYLYMNDDAKEPSWVPSNCCQTGSAYELEYSAANQGWEVMTRFYVLESSAREVTLANDGKPVVQPKHSWGNLIWPCLVKTVLYWQVCST